MNDSIKRISLDIHSTSSGETVNAKRGDTARKLIISLVDGGRPYIIGEDCYAIFTGKKPDQNVVFNDCTIKDNQIIYQFTEQTVAVEGRVNCEIKLYGADEKLITSPKFTINVFGTVYNEGDEIESSDEFNALTSLVADTQKAIKDAKEAIEIAQKFQNGEADTDLNMNHHKITGVSQIILDAGDGTDVKVSNYYKSGAKLHFAGKGNKENEPVGLTNIADGVENSDAATVGQVKEMLKNAVGSSEEAYLYTSFHIAVADLNEGTTKNADATEKDAVCAIYNDSDGTTRLMLLSDINVAEPIEFKVPIIFELNGHTVSINSDYRIVIAGDNSVVDGRTGNSRIVKETATNTVSNCLRFTGNNCKLLGGSYSIVAPADPKIVVCVAAVGDYLLIDGAEIRTSATGGIKIAYCVSTNKKVSVLNSTITCDSLEGVCVGVASINENEELLVKNSKFHITSSLEDANAYIYAIDSYNLIAENCNVFVEGEYVRCVGFYITATTTGTIRDCSAYIGSIHGSGTCLLNEGTATVENSSFFADGTTGSVSEGNENYAGTQGVANFGTISLLNCNVYGTHTGLQCGESSITKINGGLYEGPGHGGIYVACDNGGQFYAENATIRNATYRGKYKSQYWYGNGMYVVAAVYVGCGSYINAYFDNCVIDGERNEPIALRVSEGEGNNSVYISNCTIMGDGNIRFGGLTHTLYTGFCNRILCEANFPERIIDDGRKVYTGYEEYVTV